MRPILVLTAAALISISSSAAAMNGDMTTAAQEMQTANYFTFAMLLNMAPPNAFNGNITFLMPNDRTLAVAAAIAGGASVLDFLLRQSIPSPLLIDDLEHFPTGSMIPASKPGFMFKVTNGGRRRFFLSNVRISSPNICTRGNSVRCHGVDGVADPPMVPQPDMPPAPNCISPMIPAPPDVDRVPAPVAAPSPSVDAKVSGQKSSSSGVMVVDLVMMLAVMLLCFVCVVD